METATAKRKSHCSSCGTRLSSKAPSGEVRWQPSHVDDKGIICIPCFTKTKGKQHKDRHA